MKRSYISSIVFLALCWSCGQALTADQIMERSIAHHDPSGHWPDFKDSLRILLKTPDAADRLSTLYIDNQTSAFYLRIESDTNTMEYSVLSDNCLVKWNGKSEYSQTDAQALGLNCDRARMYQNYYTYLYGLPMKLKDPGANLSPEVEFRNLKGKNYVAVRADYDAEVGSDIWYFYFDTQTYAMQAYQFYRQDEQGNPDPESGEYILLSEELDISGIKMPAARAWYYNKDDKYLGTDILN